MSKGFTLVEVAVVVTIVGLVVGGILVGGSLIRASELRGFIQQGNEINSAMGLFKDQFKGLPGDLKNATTIWGAADGGDGLGADCTAVASDGSTTATCNGNGSGEIQQQPGDTYRYETWRFWQHLANAGLMEGKFTGVNHTPSGSNREAVPGENVLESKIDGVGYTILYKDSTAWTNWFTNDFERHAATVGKRGNVETRDPFLSPSEMLSLDTKGDDGKPGSGKFQTWTSGFLPNCVNGTDPVTTTYIISNNESSTACSFYIMMDY